MAKRIPGKEEFHEALSYFGRQVELTGVNLHLNRRVDASDLIAGGYDEIVLATGVAPRDPKIPGQDGPNVLSYIDVLAGRQPVGRRVAVVGQAGSASMSPSTCRRANRRRSIWKSGRPSGA